MGKTMLAATLIAGLAPTAVNLAANFLTSPRQSAHEKELRRLSKFFKEQANTPYMQTTEAQSQMRVINEMDERNRKRVTNQGIRTGATGEAEIAGMQSVNETTAEATNQVASRSGMYRDRMLNNYLNTANSAENMRLGAEAEWQGKIGAITDGVGAAANMFAIDRLMEKYGTTTIK